MLRKYFLYLMPALLSNTSIHANLSKNLQDTSLDRVIMEKVILKDYEKTGLVILSSCKRFNASLFLENEKEFIPLFYEYLYSDFNLKGNSLKAIIKEREYPINASIQRKYRNLVFVNNSKCNISRDEIQDISRKYNWSSLITSLFVLLDEKKGKCLVYYHLFDGGNVVAYLEQKNRNWEVKNHKFQTLE